MREDEYLIVYAAVVGIAQIQIFTSKHTGMLEISIINSEILSVRGVSSVRHGDSKENVHNTAVPIDNHINISGTCTSTGGVPTLISTVSWAEEKNEITQAQLWGPPRRPLLPPVVE